MAPLFLVAFVLSLHHGHWVTLSQDEAVIFFILFTAIFDAPHIFITFFRTHGDGVEFNRKPLFHCIAFVFALTVAFSFHMRGQSSVFVDFLSVYGGWHIMRQNLGFIKLYSSKARESQRLLRLRVAAGYATYVFFVMNEANSVQNVSTFFSDFFFTSAVPPQVWTLTRDLSVLILLGLFAVLARADLKLWQKERRFPAWFFYSVLSFFIALSFLPMPLLVMVAMTTIAHDIQYQAWMWLYHVRSQAKQWTAWAWLGVCTALGVLLCIPFSGDLLQANITNDWVSTGYNGLVFWHYFIDGQIWKLRSMPELKVMSVKAREISGLAAENPC